MRRIAVSIAVMLFLFLLFYLIGCFVENTFNITYWTNGFRASIGLLGGGISMLAGLAAFDLYQPCPVKEQPKKK